MDELIKDRLYWVNTGKDTWLPAYYNPAFVNGWGNYDTWENFQKEVIDWQIIEEPKK